MSTHTKISDFNGKEVPAIDIFSTAIKYLIDHIQNYHKTHGASLEVKNIKWVLTVPAMWGDPEKKFMIQAAKKVLVKYLLLFFLYQFILIFESKRIFVSLRTLKLVDSYSSNIIRLCA